MKMNLHPHYCQELEGIPELVIYSKRIVPQHRGSRAKERIPNTIRNPKEYYHQTATVTVPISKSTEPGEIEIEGIRFQAFLDEEGDSDFIDSGESVQVMGLWGQIFFVKRLQSQICTN
jgi:membrane-bound ClpP family serine protease